MKKTLFFWLLLASNGLFAQSAGFNNTFIVLSIEGSSNLYYDLNGNTANYDFNNSFIGTFCQGSTTGLIFKGGENNVYKCGGCDVTSTRIYYRIYKNGTTPGNFVFNNLGYTSGFNNGCGGQDQKWSNVSYNTNLLSGLTEGTYTMEVYSDGTATCQQGTIYASNGGANYKATFTINATSVGGSISGSQSICSASVPGDLTLSGHTGSVTKWQRSTSSDFTSGVTDIANTTTTLSGASIGSLTATTYFRAVVTSGLCSSANSSAATITVNPVTVGGSVSGAYEFCTTDNSGTLTLSGHTGNVVKWQSSHVADFSSGVSDISNTTATLNFTDVTQTTYYRAVVKSGACAEAFSTSAAVVINNNVWTGAGGDSDWNNEDNWSCGVVPTEYQNAVITAGDNGPQIDGDSTVYVASLTIGEDAAIIIKSGSNLIVTNEVNVDADGSLTIENNANLIQVNDVANSGNVEVQKNSAPIYRLDYAMWSSPVAGETLIGFSPETLSNRFYHYNPLSDAYTTIEGGNIAFEEGVGYLIRVANTHPDYVEGEAGTPWSGTFTGVPNNGDVDVTVIPADSGSGVKGFNAVGNPYPSPINIHAFYDANIGSIDPLSALYFWRKKNDGNTSSYAKVTKLAYTANQGNDWGDSSNGVFTGDNSQWMINPGQGFIVKATGSTIHFNNAMRVPVNNNQQFRTAQDEEAAISRLWLNLTGSQGAFSQAAIGYTPQTTLGVDYGWDGRAFTDGDVALFSYIGEEKIGIQARAAFTAEDVVPLGYKAFAAGSYTIALDHMDGVFAQDQDIYLRDNLLGITHDLKQEAYSFATEAGTFAGRFDVVYAQELGTDIPTLDENSIIVYQQGSSITINSGATDMTGVAVYDLRGRMLYSNENINATETVISSLQAQQQMLIIQVTTQKGKVSKKILF